VKKLMTGNEAAALAAKMANPQVVAAYPITPQISIAEKLAAYASDGEMHTRYLKVESETSALAACIGGSLSGARVFTATSSQGLALMHELLHWSAGARLPIVLVNVNRSMAAPWSLGVDHEEITLRCGVQHPDWLVIFEPNLIDNPLITGGANDKTSIVMNYLQPLSNALPFHYRNIFQVDGTAIAEGLNLKTTSFSIVNTAMVGAFAGASGLVKINRLVKIIRDLVPIKKEENAAAARQAFKTVQEVSDG
jgi:hypothetical protein